MKSAVSGCRRLAIQVALLQSMAFCASAAMAVAPNIGGNVTINVEVGNIVNFAEAPDSVAQVAIGSVSEGNLGGFNATVVVGDVVNQATGNGSCAQVLIGSAGIPSCVAGSAAAP